LTTPQGLGWQHGTASTARHQQAVGGPSDLLSKFIAAHFDAIAQMPQHLTIACADASGCRGAGVSLRLTQWLENMFNS